MKHLSSMLYLCLLTSQSNSQIIQGSSSYYNSRPQVPHWGGSGGIEQRNPSAQGGFYQSGNPFHTSSGDQGVTLHEDHRDNPSEETSQYYNHRQNAYEVTESSEGEVQEVEYDSGGGEEGFRGSESYSPHGGPSGHHVNTDGGSSYPGYSHFQLGQDHHQNPEIQREEITEDHVEQEDSNLDFERFENFGRDEGHITIQQDYGYKLHDTEEEQTESYVHHEPHYAQESSFGRQQEVQYESQPQGYNFNSGIINQKAPSHRAPVRFNPYGGYQVYVSNERSPSETVYSLINDNNPSSHYAESSSNDESNHNRPEGRSFSKMVEQRPPQTWTSILTTP